MYQLNCMSPPQKPKLSPRSSALVAVTEMENSKGLAVMTVFAVSGTVVYVALQFHKHLLSSFLNQAQSDVQRHQGKKKVHFADDVMEPSSNNKEYRMRRHTLSTIAESS